MLTRKKFMAESTRRQEQKGKRGKGGGGRGKGTGSSGIGLVPQKTKKSTLQEEDHRVAAD